MCVFVVAVLVSACAKPRIRDGSTCAATCNSLTRYRLDPGFSAEETDAIKRGLNVWTGGTGGRECFQQGGLDLIFVRVERRIELRAYDDGYAGHNGLYRRGVVWLVASALSDRELEDVTVHEVGHYLGLDHIKDTPDSVMLAQHGRRVGDELPERDRIEYCKIHHCSCGSATPF